MDKVPVYLDFHDFLNRRLYDDGTPGPIHGHCGFRMVKDAQGYYYCKHCEDLAREEADPNSEASRILRLKRH